MSRTPEWLETDSLEELGKSLVKINARIEELQNTDWTAKIAAAVRRNPEKAQEFVELERDAADDLRLAEGKKLAVEQRIAEVREAERGAKLELARTTHAKAIADCRAALKAGGSAFLALVKAVDGYESARATAARSLADEFDLLDFAEGCDRNELYLSKPGQAGLGTPISKELAELAGSLTAIATRARAMTGSPPVGVFWRQTLKLQGVQNEYDRFARNY